MTDSEILQRYVDEVQPVTNWPKWEAFGTTRELCKFGTMLWERIVLPGGAGGSLLKPVGDHEALCGWQNHTIAWLQKRFTYVSIEWDGTAKQWLVMAGFYVPKGDDTGNVQFKADSHDKNIHLALIAAAKTAKEN